MTQYELEEIESLVFALNSQMDEVSDKYDDVNNLLRFLEDESVKDICTIIEEVQEEYEELCNRLSDLEETISDITKITKKMGML